MNAKTGVARILIFANHSGGLYDFRRELIEALTSYGQVTAAVPNSGKWDELARLNIRLIETPLDRRGMDPFKDIKLFWQYLRILRAEKPQLALTYTIKPNIYGALACRLLRIPYAVNITGLGSAIENGGPLKRFVLALYKLALKSARVVLFENQGNRASLAAAGVVPQGRDAVLNGAGVNLARFAALPYPPARPVRFLFVGRVMREKGIAEFFAAAQALKQKHGRNVQFCIAGSFEEAFKPQMDELEAAGIIEYLGYKQNIAAEYATAHCIVLPSWHEGMSNVLLEAAASARPLIASDIPGCREAVLNGQSGFVCAPRSSAALIGAMESFLALSPAQMEAMGRRGRELMQNKFDKNAVVAQTLRLLGLDNG